MNHQGTLKCDCFSGPSAWHPLLIVRRPLYMLILSEWDERSLAQLPTSTLAIPANASYEPALGNITKPRARWCKAAAFGVQRERLHELNAKVQGNHGGRRGRSDSGKGIVAFLAKGWFFGWLVFQTEGWKKLALSWYSLPERGAPEQPQPRASRDHPWLAPFPTKTMSVMRVMMRWFICEDDGMTMIL